MVVMLKDIVLYDMTDTHLGRVGKCGYCRPLHFLNLCATAFCSLQTAHCKAIEHNNECFLSTKKLPEHNWLFDKISIG